MKTYVFTEETMVLAQGGSGHGCNEVFISISVLNHTQMTSNSSSVIFHLVFVSIKMN